MGPIAAVGADPGWLLATSAVGSGTGTAITLHHSKDGVEWTSKDGAAAGLPEAGAGFQPLSMAAGTGSVLLVGQQQASRGTGSPC
ncbi:hypothetical protein [Pseudarthrobacter sp. N5]|uniref:hypothetical protein n=1 Tax=Pseudarthrobacter sp. N5 TaxID=3418416 RepID=UPI003CF47E19